MLNRRIIAPKPKLISQNTCREICAKTKKTNNKDFINNISFQDDILTENLTQEFHDLEAKKEILEILKSGMCNSMPVNSDKRYKIHPILIKSFLDDSCEHELKFPRQQYQHIS